MCILSTPPQAPSPSPPHLLLSSFGWSSYCLQIEATDFSGTDCKETPPPRRTQASLKPVPLWVCAWRMLPLLSGMAIWKSLDTASPGQMLCFEVLDYVKMLSIALTLSRLWTRPTYQRIQKTKNLLVKSHWVDPTSWAEERFQEFQNLGQEPG